jgi:hypothetical protein
MCAGSFGIDVFCAVQLFAHPKGIISELDEWFCLDLKFNGAAAVSLFLISKVVLPILPPRLPQL